MDAIDQIQVTQTDFALEESHMMNQYMPKFEEFNVAEDFFQLNKSLEMKREQQPGIEVKEHMRFSLHHKNTYDTHMLRPHFDTTSKIASKFEAEKSED